MNRSQMVAPFAEEELRTFEGRGGKTMTYIEDETVMDRLDAGYGYGNWQIHVDADQGGTDVVKVRLSVRENGEWISFEDFGYPNREGGETLKEAVSDGIRRCGRYVGIARDLYRKSTYEPGGALGPKGPSEPDVRAEITTDGGLIGTAEKGTARTSDYLLRETSEGWFLGFRLKGGGRKAGFLVEAHDAMAQALALVEADVIGQRCQVWGHWVERKLTKGSYQAFYLERISTPTITLPAPDGERHADATTPVASGDTTNPVRADAAVGTSGATAAVDPAAPPHAGGATGELPAGTLTPVARGAGEPSQTTEAGPSLPEAVTAGADAASMSGAATLCHAVGSDFGTVCSLEKGHAGKHRELATDGRVLASW